MVVVVGGGGGVRGFKMFCQNFFYLLCVCGGEGGRFSTSPSVKKITDPLLLINDKKSQRSLRRLSFSKILLVQPVTYTETYSAST